LLMTETMGSKKWALKFYAQYFCLGIGRIIILCFVHTDHSYSILCTLKSAFDLTMFEVLLICLARDDIEVNSCVCLAAYLFALYSLLLVHLTSGFSFLFVRSLSDTIYISMIDELYAIRCPSLIFLSYKNYVIICISFSFFFFFIFLKQIRKWHSSLYFKHIKYIKPLFAHMYSS
jgi:hypothetical protein